MPLLNPPDILPEAMRFLVRAILASSGRQLPRDELLAMVAPTGLVEAMDSLGADAEGLSGDDSDLHTGGLQIARASLSALRTLGFVEFSGDAVAATSELDDWKSYRKGTATAFSHLLLNAFVARAAESTSPDGEGVGDLRDALGILYSSEDPLWPVSTFEAGRDTARRAFGDEQRKRLGDDRGRWPIPNREQYMTFTRWGPYLGLVRPVGSNGLIADASVALRALLPTDLAGELGVAEFVAVCARALPLLDGGSMHSHFDVEESGGHAVLSPVMSITMLQLEEEGLVSLKRLSDVGLRTIRTSASGVNDRAISHVTWTGQSRGKGRKS